MALSELAALDAAYQVLRPLNAAARRRALQWLSDALATESVLPSSVVSSAPPAVVSPSGASSSGTATPRRSGRRAATSSAAGASSTGAPRKRATRASRTAETPKRAEAARRGSRPYRRMPPVEEVMAAYRHAGSVSAMADHFGVPGHTVQGWARQLRRNGYAIGQSR